MATADDRVDLDLNKVTTKELAGLENPVLKRLLLQVKQRMDEEATRPPESMEYSSFCSHEVFYNYGGIEPPSEPGPGNVTPGDR